MKKINFGIIGTGIMANIYAKILQQKPESDLLCVVGNTEERTRKFAINFNIKFFSNSNYEKMFKHFPEIDAVIITTPEWIRLEPVKISIKYNKHILLEKPFTKSIEDADTLYKLLNDYNKTFEICHVLRHSPRFYSLKKSIENGDIGEIRHIYARRNSNNIRVKRVLGKTDLAFWLTPHDIDIMRWLTNSEVSEVYAVSRNKLLSHDDYLTTNLKFKNNVNAVLQISWCNPPLSGSAREAVFEIWGTKGYIELEDFNMNIKVFSENNEVKTYDTYEDFEIHGIHHGIFENLITYFIERVYNKSVNNLSLNDAYASTLACEMVSKSIKEEKIINIEKL